MRTRDEIGDVKNKLGIPADAKINVGVNPLRVAESYEFGCDGDGDYRERAIKRVLANRVSFTSEFNSISELAKRIFPEAKCPSCRNSIARSPSSGGNSHGYYFTYTCDCGYEVVISVPHDFIRVSVKEKK